jgi:hypothetical protein
VPADPHGDISRIKRALTTWNWRRPDLGAGEDLVCGYELKPVARQNYYKLIRRLRSRYPVFFSFAQHRFYLQYKRRIFCSNTGNTGYLAFNGACITNSRNVVFVPDADFQVTGRTLIENDKWSPSVLDRPHPNFCRPGNALRFAGRSLRNGIQPFLEFAQFSDERSAEHSARTIS